jgi:hypothetical protein
MAITGIFEADFSKFQAAVEGANVSLKDFQSNGDKVQASINRIGDSFSGVKIIQQATQVTKAITDIGGASSLTATEQARVNSILDEAIAKYAVLGQQAPPAMVELANATKQVDEESTLFGSTLGDLAGQLTAVASVGAAISFGKNILEGTAALEDLSRATGVSTDDLQKFAYVGDEFGVQMDVMARGVEQLSAKLANGDANAVSAVEKLGLSVDDLLKEGPAQAFQDVAKAVGSVEDPMTRAGIAAELFGGKLAKTLLPLLSDLTNAMNRVPKDALISEATIKSAHDFEIGIDHLATRMKAFVASEVKDFHDAWLELGDIITNQQTPLEEEKEAMGRVAKSMETAATSTAPVLTNAQLLQNKLDALNKEALAPLTEQQKKNILTLQQYGEGLKEIAKDVGSNEVAVKLFVDAHKAAEEQAKKNAEAMKKLADELEHLSEKMKVTSGVTQALLDELDGLSKGAVADLDLITGAKQQQQVLDLQQAFVKLTSLGLVPTAAELEKMGEMANKLFEAGAQLTPDLIEVAAETGNLGVKATDAWPKLEGLGQTLKIHAPDVVKYTDALRELSTMFGELGRAISAVDPTIGHLVESFGKASAAIDNAEKSFTNATKAFSAGDTLTGLASIASGIGGIASAAIAAGGAIVNLWDKFFGSAGRDAVVSFASTFQGGFSGLQQQLNQLGAEGQQLWISLTQGVGRNDPTAAAAAINKVTTALNNLHQAQNTQIQGLISSIQSFGGAVPAALDPYIQKLQQAGQLTDANAKALQALESGGKPTYDELVTLQQKYNLTAAQMGSSFNVAQIDANFQTVIDDLDTLTRGGTDVLAAMFQIGTDGAEALSGLGTAIQGDIEAAIQAGVAIPDNLKAAAQALINQGDLLDSSGKKITDINQLQFGETMQTSLDNLNKTLQDLIATMTGDDPNSFASALKNIGNTVVHPVVAPVYDDSGLPPSYRGGTPAGATASAPSAARAAAAAPSNALSTYRSPSGAIAARAGNITIVTQLDGRTVAQNQVKYIPSALALAGI